jgi:NTE family protein
VDSEQPKRLAIACQGGGSQTAFTGGVLKKLLQQRVQEKYKIVGISGTSGGAICAFLAWYGLLKAARGSTDTIYQGLVSFWQDNSAKLPWEKFLNDYCIKNSRMLEQGKLPSYETSPYNWQWQWLQTILSAQAPRKEFLDLRKLLEKHVNFSDLETLIEPSSPRLLMGAVDVLSGEFRTFDSKLDKITVEMILASAAVPSLFPAVEVEGNFYWDGLFAENPPLIKFLQTIPDEVWIIGINPVERKTVPKTPECIVDRRNELAGNIMLSIELRFFEVYNELLRRGALTQEFLAEVPITPTKLRLINMTEALAESLDYSSKLDRNPSYIKTLFADGETQAEKFWQNPDDEAYNIPPSWHTKDQLFENLSSL